MILRRSALLPRVQPTMNKNPLPAMPTITGSTRVFAVLGDPVMQVQAPRVFNTIFARHGVDAVLVPAQVTAAALPGFVRHVTAAGNIDGLWVTIPHKPACASIVDHCDTAAALAGSVNAVRRDADGSLHGALFDGLGFVHALDHFGFAPRGRRVLLLGAGGAGAAIALALCEAGVATLALHDLGDRATRLAARLAGHAGATRVEVASADPAGFDLVVNATPLGLNPGDPLPVDPARLDAACLVVDILMKDRPTTLLRACATRGIQAHAGHEMLVQQVPDYLDFFGLHAAALAVREELPSLRALMGAAA
jgi:shikimate dehydrogenase